jgi:hypothetical protein
MRSFRELALPHHAGRREIASGYSVTFSAPRSVPDQGMMTHRRNRDLGSFGLMTSVHRLS